MVNGCSRFEMTGAWGRGDKQGLRKEKEGKEKKGEIKTKRIRS